MKWLTGTFFGAPRWLWLSIGLVLAITGAILAYTRLADAENEDDKRNQEIGATIQREGDLQETVERVEKANEVREEVSAEAAVGRGERLYSQCLRSNRGTPDDCKRFLPERPTN